MPGSKTSVFNAYRVQESDGNFFESFTALSWRQENKRLRAASDVSTFELFDVQGKYTSISTSVVYTWASLPENTMNSIG